MYSYWDSKCRFRCNLIKRAWRNNLLMFRRIWNEMYWQWSGRWYALDSKVVQTNISIRIEQNSSKRICSTFCTSKLKSKRVITFPTQPTSELFHFWLIHSKVLRWNKIQADVRISQMFILVYLDPPYFIRHVQNERGFIVPLRKGALIK
jgi:hypothetical protein